AADNGSVGLEFGDSKLALSDAVLAQRPALRSYAGKEVAVGVRSEDMEDATLATVPSERSIRGQVALTEALGSQVIVHFSFPGEGVATEDTNLIGKDSGGLEPHIGSGTGIRWVASFAPRSRVKMGDDIEIAVDVERAHFFDPQTSLAIAG